MDDLSFQPYLCTDEQLLWTGAPKRKFRFERKHLPLLFFALPFLAFFIMALAGILAPHPHKSSAPAPDAQATSVGDVSKATPPAKAQTLPERIVETLFFLVFFIGIFGWVAFCFASATGLKGPLRDGTIYGVTNQRLIIVAGKKSKIVRSLHLGSITDLRMKEWPDGLGTISFGPESAWPYSPALRDGKVELENIPNPREVFQIIIVAGKTA